jgi:hypothetical protein
MRDERGPEAGQSAPAAAAAGTGVPGDPDVDLVVAGAGGGLAGALRAAEAGLSVLVVDPDEQFLRGNNTSMSTAMIPGAGSRWQREAGVVDDPARFLADISAKTHGTADPVLASALTAISAPLVEWLADEAGLPLKLVRDFSYPGHSADRLHTVEGRHGSALLRHLYERVRLSPSVDTLIPARLVDVTTADAANAADDGAGRITSAVVEYPSGHRETIATRAVLLATNGYGANATWWSGICRRSRRPTTTAASSRAATVWTSGCARVPAPPSWTPIRATRRSPAALGHWSAGPRSRTARSWSTRPAHGSATRRRATPSTRRPSRPGPGRAAGSSSTAASTTCVRRSPTSGRP